MKKFFTNLTLSFVTAFGIGSILTSFRTDDKGTFYTLFFLGIGLIILEIVLVLILRKKGFFQNNQD